MKSLGLLGCALLLNLQCVHVWAGANDDGKAFASSMLSGSVGAATKDPNNSSAVPNYTANPAELNMNTSQVAMADAARVKQATDDNVGFVNTMVTTRPVYSLDKNNDPLFKSYSAIEGSAAQMISSNYQGCTAVPVSGIVQGGSQQSCTSNAYIQFSCSTHYVKKCTNPLAGQNKPFTVSDFNLLHIDAGSVRQPLTLTDMGAGQFTLASANNGAVNGRGTGGRECQWYTEQITVNQEEAGTIKQLAISNISYDDWVIIYVNNEKIIQDIGAQQNAPDAVYPCEQRGTHFAAQQVDLAPKLVVGNNYIIIQHQIGGAGMLKMTINAQRVEACRPSYNYERTCDAGYSPTNATMLSNNCNGSWTVNEWGQSICEGFNETYQSQNVGAMKESSQCQALKTQGCTQASRSICTKMIGGKCAEQSTTFDCGTTTAPRTVAACGETLICPDGKCTSDIGQTKGDATGDFKDAATKLEVAGALVTDINANKIAVFKGAAKQCTDKSFGFSNCCNDSGWGQDVGLANCPAEAKELGIAKQNKSAHYVGTYTTSSSFGLIETDHKVYCTFGSKLSRIVQEQGRPQIGMSWGSARSPNCDGFTIDQVGQLNFSNMDLSEFYVDVMNKANNGTTPSQGGAASKIQADLQSYFK